MRWIRTACLLYALFIAFVVVSASSGWFPEYFTFVRTYAGDKLLHFLMVGALATLLNLSLPGLTVGRLPFGTAIMLFIATVEEVSQIWFATRTFDLFDLMCNYLGIVTLGGVGWWLSRRLADSPAAPPVGLSTKTRDFGA